ncbi:hypothetical protein ACFSKW_11300 [Nonomuraea mangrovi]|uniref:SMI1/KNR4 family protein n=1 Tax=Nonomuraea mangrovi TaxID=2316207 RepID=A0ABW4SSY5_9ACTN
MSDDFDLATEAVEGFQDRHHAWRFIRRFAESWSRPLSKDDGFSEAEIDAAEKRLGLQLPVALREAYVLFGKRDDLCHWHNRLQRPDELEVFGEAGLLYHAENQGCWGRYIRLTDLHLADPPTRESCDCLRVEHQSGVPYAERLSAALVAMVLSEAFAGPREQAAYGELLTQDISEVDRLFTRMDLPVLGTDCTEAPRGEGRWYIGKDALLYLSVHREMCDDDDPWNRPRSKGSLRVRTRTPHARRRLMETLPSEWFNWWW